MKKPSVSFFRNGVAATFMFAVSMAVVAVDVREKHVFKGPFDMHTARGVKFEFSCEEPKRVHRRYVYIKSGDGYYKIPFSVDAAGKSVVCIDRNDCMGEEGKVAGWRNVDEIMVSFWREDCKPVKWSVSSLEFDRRPYNAVVVAADRCVHAFPKKLEACGMDALLVGADELDARILENVALVAPIGGKRKYPQKTMSMIRQFKSRGGVILSSNERLAAVTHRQLLNLLVKRLPKLKDVFAQKLADAGICVRAGLHCAPLAHESAGTLSTGTVRVSFGYDADRRRSEAFLKAVNSLLKQ